MTKEQIKEFTLRTTNSNHSGLILVLVDVVNVYISDSICAYNSEDKEQYLKNIRLAKKAHNELMSCINPRDELGKKVLVIFRFSDNPYPLIPYIIPKLTAFDILLISLVTSDSSI